VQGGQGRSAALAAHLQPLQVAQQRLLLRPCIGLLLAQQLQVFAQHGAPGGELCHPRLELRLGA
jgi:hypothetical protein